MFNSTVLEVAIGLFFTYLLLSLICSALNEAVARFLKSRSENLEEGITRLLQDTGEKQLVGKFYAHPLIKAIDDGRKPSYIPSDVFALVVADIIKSAASAPVPTAPAPASAAGAAQVGASAPATAAVAPAVPVSLTQLQTTLQTASTGPVADLAKSLVLVIGDAKDLTEGLRRIETWYDQSMERVQGWYKRQAQTLIRIWAVIVTLALNVDTIEIAQKLYGDDALRRKFTVAGETLVQTAPAELARVRDAANTLPEGPLKQSFTNNYTAGDSLYTYKDKVAAAIAALNTEAIESNLEKLTNAQNRESLRHFLFTDPRAEVARLSELPIGWKREKITLATPAGEIVSKIAGHSWGWILTMVALSLGAPFWFDMLNKVVNFRATGQRPATRAQKDAK
jgi:hypothetical protein